MLQNYCSHKEILLIKKMKKKEYGNLYCCIESLKLQKLPKGGKDISKLHNNVSFIIVCCKK